MSVNNLNAVGRRKSSVARVQIQKGNGNIKINGIEVNHYLQYSAKYLQYLKEPLTTVQMEDEIDIIVNVNGGGISGQCGAIRLGVARALCKMNGEYRANLKQEGCLTRDARVKERKKYGLKKARKASQYSKR
uniref:ribosomal protein S9 n=1 Tax=Rhodaphanes brevistipitata TaxID=446136 RepID=UPI001FCE019E|nr:ribosomal protein S9 [Rhodaphanes brevistipitata]UNJ18464.1 ribosomal protein S9 [Rhodaphanes brevistipitata]